MEHALLNQFVWGAIVACCAMGGLFFLRFYRRTRDRLLLVFAIAFWVLGLNWLALAFTQSDEVKTTLYFVRLLAFLFIAIGILHKNRSPQQKA